MREVCIVLAEFMAQIAAADLNRAYSGFLATVLDHTAYHLSVASEFRPALTLPWVEHMWTRLTRVRPLPVHTLTWTEVLNSVAQFNAFFWKVRSLHATRPGMVLTTFCRFSFFCFWSLPLVF